MKGEDYKKEKTDSKVSKEKIRSVISCDCHLYKGKYLCKKCGHYHYTSSFGGWGETCFHMPSRTEVNPISAEQSNYQTNRIAVLSSVCKRDDVQLIDRLIAAAVWQKFDGIFGGTPHSALDMVRFGAMIGRLYGREK